MSRRCDNCNNDVLRAPFIEHVRSAKHREDEIVGDNFFPSNCFNKSNESNITQQRYLILKL